MSSTVNCSDLSRATRSSTTVMVVQAVSLSAGKVKVPETCSKSVLPGEMEKIKLQNKVNNLKMCLY